MAYVALYRKYRPTNFESVAGQKYIVQTLKNAVKQNKIAHAYLFCGPRGTGKTSIAKIFAKMINCEHEENKPCNECDNCFAMQSNSHPDIIEIDAASNNGVDEVRNLIEKVKYAPLKGKYKVYIIDEVHMMSTGAFNALLKTIEEPPAHVIFIFATTEPHKVLPTIISRCQRYDFTKISVNDMMERVKTGLDCESIKYEEEAIRLVCQLADGGMRDAWSIVDQVISYSQDLVSVEAVNAIYGIVTVSEKIELLQLIADKKATECMEKVNQFVERGIDIKRCTNDLIEILKESVIHDYTKDSKLLTIMNDEEVRLSKINKNTKERLLMIDELMKTYDKYRFASNVNTYFEVCLLNMMAIEVETNVSRETSTPIVEVKVEKQEEVKEIKKPQEKREVKGLNREYVLSLLVGANIQYKKEDIIQYERLSNYYLNPIWARYANLLRETTIFSSSRNYIILSVKNQAIANEINEVDEQGSFIEFMEVLLGRKKKVFAITEDEMKILINEFKERKNNGTLPAAANVDVEEDSEQLIKDFFGEENVEIEE